MIALIVCQRADTPKVILFFEMASTSDTKELERRITAIRKQLEREVNDRLPRKVGVIAKQHFTENFHRSGFVDGGVALGRSRSVN